MFGKWFDSAYTGSMAGSGADVFAVWTYAIAHAGRDGNVELNPLVIAGLIGMPVENVERAIEFLCQPDPKSRNPAHEGRRLIYETGFLYEIVSQPIYLGMKNAEDRREYLRVKQQESRARRKSTKVNNGQQVSTQVNTSQPGSTHIDVDIDKRLELTLLSPEATEPKLRPEEFANLWNRLRSRLPRVEQFSESRKKKVLTRMRQGITLERFERAVRCCTEKPFLRGDGPQGWAATFDWLVENDSNIEKAITGYNGGGGEKSQPEIRIRTGPVGG